MNIPTPYSDELLTSWLFRVTRSNHTRNSIIVDKLFKLKRFYKKDFDLYNFTETNLNIFYKITNLSNIEELQLRKYHGFLEENINIDGRKRWILLIAYSEFEYNSRRGIRMGSRAGLFSRE